MRHALMKKAFMTAALCALMGLGAGCAPQGSSEGQSADGADKAAAESIQVEWSPDSDCAVCHKTEAASMGDESTGACAHVREAQADCVTCHIDEAALSEAHEKAAADKPMPTRLKKTSVGVEACQNGTCHNAGQEDMLALAAGSLLVDANGTEVNPHEVIGKTPGHADIACADCHKEHGAKATVDSTHNVCLTCHHADVFECKTCHE